MPKDFRFHLPTAEAAIAMARQIQRARFLAGDMTAADGIRQACFEIEKTMGITPDRPVAGRELNRFREWMNGSSGLIDGLSFPTSQKLRVGLTLLHLSLEHQDSICELITLGLVGSAFALLRPQFEACLRGTWVLMCASDEQVRQFVNGEEPPKARSMAESIEPVIGSEHNLLRLFHTKVFPFLHDFTHGGVAQVKARNTPTEIASDYSEEGMIWLMTNSAILGALSGSIMIDHTDTSRGPSFTSLYDSLYSHLTLEASSPEMS